MAAMRLGRVGANWDTKLGDYAEFLLYGGGMDANALQGFGTCPVGSYRVCGGRRSRAMRCGGGRVFTGGGMTWGDRNESAGTLTNSYLQCERHGAMAILLELLEHLKGSRRCESLSGDARGLQSTPVTPGKQGPLGDEVRGASWATFGAAAFLRVATNTILERVSQGQYHVSKGLGECGSFYVNMKECVRVNSEWARNVRNVSRTATEGLREVRVIMRMQSGGLFNEGHTNCLRYAERSMDSGISRRDATGCRTIWGNSCFFDVALWTTGPSAWGFEFLSVNPRGGLQNDMLRGLWPKPTTKPTHNTST
ncbi:hypothetical protein BD779DRAFT_1790898 [Infundibulicybe gibba]|nr:hypothetical protein BD779DRAFT_1790898 [Infundibulicybe gibba]